MTAAPTVPTGNTFDKYGSTNPVVRRLMSRFNRTLRELFLDAAPDSVLDIGCGEGVLTEQWAIGYGSHPPPGRIVGVDLEDPKLETEWATRTRPNLQFTAMPVESLSFADDEFDLVAATEVLEHVGDPEIAVAEMARVARRWLLVSVPHEPLWRMLNVARGAYVSELGNTPGHLNHWSRAGFERLLGAHGQVVETRSPFPWTMLLVRV
jgi:2-polyprenyl-3-methyl-5-hydroxy-6-metoxy-1,4-benzoquinol methylase